MKQNIIFVLVVFAQVLTAQISDLPEFKKTVNFSEAQYEKNDTTRRNKVFENNQPQIIYNETDSLLIRTEYFQNGRIKSIAEIKQEIGIDSSYYVEFKTRKNKLIILQRLIDIPNGKYIEYHNLGINQIKKSEGVCSNYKRIGTWKFYEFNGNKTIANFNDEGELTGKYYEYYFNKQDSTYQIKIEGEYGLKYLNQKNSKMNTNQYYESTKKETRRIGVWKYYSREGLLLETSKHTWEN